MLLSLLQCVGGRRESLCLFFCFLCLASSGSISRISLSLALLLNLENLRLRYADRLCMKFEGGPNGT